MRHFISCSMVAALLLTASLTAAQEAPSSPAVATPPDVVLLKDGGMVRGTISELKANDFVVITLSSGENRKIPMSEVGFAGPANEAPSHAARAETAAKAAAVKTEPVARKSAAPEGTVRVDFDSEPSGVRFHIRTGESVGQLSGTGLGGPGLSVTVDDYASLCEAPCSANLRPGTYVFGLSTDDDAPVKAEESITIDKDTPLYGRYVSYGGMRVAGWITLVASVVGGTAMMITSVPSCSGPGACSPNMGLLVGGAAVMIGGGTVGFFMTRKSDEAELSHGEGPEARAHSPRQHAMLTASGHF